ncbi:MAG: hypothetical protein HC923_03255 [Myxococcales bacterium]|nr:hypothetical protein [Myxococcales bacterium]
MLTAGNWDRFAAREPEAMEAMCRERGIVWLVDREADVKGLRVYGSPWVPRFGDMAFNLGRGEPLRQVWQKLPHGLDLLVTHGPPYGILDRMFLGLAVGDETLREAVLQKTPRFHVFGHIHEARGTGQVEGCPTQFLNVASSRLLSGVFEPTMLEL